MALAEFALHDAPCDECRSLFRARNYCRHEACLDILEEEAVAMIEEAFDVAEAVRRGRLRVEPKPAEKRRSLPLDGKEYLERWNAQREANEYAERERMGLDRHDW